VFVANSLPAGSSFDAATGVFSWDAAGPAGDYSLTITPNDGIFSGIPQTVLIAVTASGAAGGGGGGSMGWPDVLALLSLTVLGVYFRRRYGPKR
jgi:hypothetical protein